MLQRIEEKFTQPNTPIHDLKVSEQYSEPEPYEIETQSERSIYDSLDSDKFHIKLLPC